MEGWIKLHRQILESEVFASEKALKVWVWLLLKARHSKGFVPIKIGDGQHTVELQKGQILFGRVSAASELRLAQSFIYRCLKKFQRSKMIVQESNSHYTVISIVNFEKFNDEVNSQRTATEPPVDNKWTTSGQPLNTNKNDNNVKNEKKEGEVFFITIGKETFKSKPSEIVVKYPARFETLLLTALKGIDTTALLSEFDKEYSASGFDDIDHFFNALKRTGKQILNPPVKGYGVNTTAAPKVIPQLNRPL